MQSDRELIELAAKAAGYIRMEYREEVPYVSVNWNGDDFVAWNPLTDDGDSLRLAVKLKIHPETFTGYTIASYQPDDDSEWLELEEWGDDPYAATRRAITRAAAQLAQAAQSSATQAKEQ